MTIRLYLDEDSMDRTLLAALRLQGADAMTAAEAGMGGQSDEQELIYATSQSRALYSFNIRDYHRLHAAFLGRGQAHAGIILAEQGRYSVGEQMRRLIKVIATLTAEDLENQIIYLSAWG